MPMYQEQNVGGVQAKNYDMEEEDEDYETQNSQMNNAKDEEQI